MAKLLHICEVCGLSEILESEVAFEAGWDYPPGVGVFGIVTPRTCPDCTMEETVWWALAIAKTPTSEMTSKQLETLKRISEERESILIKEQK